MIYVKVYKLNPKEDQDQIVGTIGWDGQQFILNPPDDTRLNNMMSGSVDNPRNDQPVTADSDPAAWLAGLRYRYRGPYLWVSGPKATTVAYQRDGIPIKYGDKESFEKVIDKNPLDATNHLVFADWLDENGQPEEAAFRRELGQWFQDMHTYPALDDNARPIPESIIGTHKTGDGPFAFSYDPTKQTPWGVYTHLPGGMTWRDVRVGGFVRPDGSLHVNHGPLEWKHSSDAYSLGGWPHWKTYKDMEEGLRRAFMKRYANRKPQ